MWKLKKWHPRRSSKFRPSIRPASVTRWVPWWWIFISPPLAPLANNKPPFFVVVVVVVKKNDSDSPSPPNEWPPPFGLWVGRSKIIGHNSSQSPSYGFGGYRTNRGEGDQQSSLYIEWSVIFVYDTEMYILGMQSSSFLLSLRLFLSSFRPGIQIYSKEYIMPR